MSSQAAQPALAFKVPDSAVAQEAQPSRKAPVGALHLAYTHDQLKDHVKDAVEHAPTSHAGKDLSSASAGSYPNPGGMVEADTQPSSSRSGSGDLSTPHPPASEVSVFCRALVVWCLLLGCLCRVCGAGLLPPSLALTPLHTCPGAHPLSPTAATLPPASQEGCGEKTTKRFCCSRVQGHERHYQPPTP